MNPPNKLTIIRRALIESDKIWSEWHRQDVCIGACRSLQIAMRALGITLDPVVARARFLNATMFAAVESGELDQYPDLSERRAWMERTGAWGVGLGYLDPVVTLGFEPMPENKWGKHLALIERTESLFIDPTIGQASRPNKKIDLPQSIASEVPARFFAGDGEIRILFGSAIAFYRVYPRENGTWATSPDWREKRRHKVFVKRILKAIERK